MLGHILLGYLGKKKTPQQLNLIVLVVVQAYIP